MERRGQPAAQREHGPRSATPALCAGDERTLEQRLDDALAQQAATSEILRVMAASSAEVQPVLDAIARQAAVLCRAPFARVILADGNIMRALAEFSADSEPTSPMQAIPLDRTSISGRATLEGVTVNYADVTPLLDSEFPAARDNARRTGFRAVLAVPLPGTTRASGAIFLWRREAVAFSPDQVALVETFARQAAIALGNVRQFHAIRESLDRQTATSEILRVISRSPTDTSPVFETIAAAGLRLCQAESVVVGTYDGTLLHVGAIASTTAAGAEAIRALFPRPAGRDNGITRAVLECGVVSIPDVLEDPDYATAQPALASGFRSVLAVPLIRHGVPIGAISLGRAVPGAFSAGHVALLETFGDQAVIAIENVRLFAELETRNRDLSAALDRQTATGEVLRVISESRTDVQPVFHAIAAAALKLCGARSANVVTFDGELIHVAAVASEESAAANALRHHFGSYPRPPSADTANTRAVLTRSVVMIPDVLDDVDYAAGATAVAAGYRSVLAVPLLRGESPLGALTVARSVPGSFPDPQIALLQTFADQAVIAIENVRLLDELERRNRDLVQALEQQTATSDILRVISRSNADVQPVFDTIVRSARALCDATFSGVYRVDGEMLSLVAADGMAPDALARFAAGFPRRVGPDTVTGHAALERRVVQTPDLIHDPRYSAAPGASVGARTVLGVPLMREGQAIGAIGVWRAEVRPFDDAQIALLQTFADQAVIAIENVRLFTELRVRTAELTRSVAELRALGEVGQAVSSSLDLATVLSTIVARATALTGMDGGSLYEYDEARGEFHVYAADRLSEELVTTLRAHPIRKGEGALGRMAIAGEPVQIADIVDEGSYQSRVRDLLVGLGYRALLAVPLMRDDRVLGGLAVLRRTPGRFDEDVIALLRTFAAQSAIAIQNARLFREIEVKSRELERASRHKSEFLANMSHELRTPLNAILGFSEVLAERMFGEINAKQAEYLEDILGSGRHLLSLINDILDLSKIEAGRMELELGDVDVASVVGNTLMLVGERAQRREIRLNVHVDPAAGVIRADERKVKQVLLNLLSNALKFTPEGGTVSVQAGGDVDAVEIAVSDTGVGISPEDQAMVFEEFRQVGAASKKVEGTGLGLAITRKFVELHGGAIRVESAVGRGATFAFRLPRAGPAG